MLRTAAEFYLMCSVSIALGWTLRSPDDGVDWLEVLELVLLGPFEAIGDLVLVILRSVVRRL